MPENWPDFNDLWDYGDPAETEVTFRELLARLDDSADPAYRLQLLTQIGRTLSLQRKFAESHAVLDQVEAARSGDPVVEARYLLERGRAFASDRQPEMATPLFQRAFEVARSAGADFYAVDALHMLAIAAPPEERLSLNLKAIEYAANSPQERGRNWLASLYNNTGWAYFDRGEYAQALDQFVRALEHRERLGDEGRIRIARWSVARVLRALGRIEEALAILRELAAQGDSDGFVDEEIAECLYVLGCAEEARPFFQWAYEKLSKIDWVAEDA